MSFTPPSGPSYGLKSAYVFAGYQPIVSQRAPTANDRAALGQTWVDVPNQDSYTLVAIVANAAVWMNTAGGAGVFTSLTVNPGPTAITGLFTLTSGAGNTANISNDASDHNVVLGSVTGISNTTIQAGSGILGLFPADTGDIVIGTPTQDNTTAVAIGISTLGQSITIGSADNTVAQVVELSNGDSAANSVLNIMSGTGTAGAAVVAFGSNPRLTTMGIANVAPSAARTITIAGGNQAQNDTVSVLNGAPSANTQTFNLMSGTATGGTQAVNIGNGIGGSLTVSMGNGVNTTAQTVNIANGASAANSTVNILSGVGTAGAGVLALGNNTRVTTIGIGNIAPAAARLTTIAGGNQAQDDTVSILNGSASAGNQVMNVLSGTIGAGATGTINLLNGANAGAQAINIASGASAANNTVSILNGVATAGTQAVNIANGNTAATATVNILSGTPTAGTQTLNLGAQTTRAVAINMGSGTGLATVQIANGAAANLVTVGSTTGAAKTTINSGSLSMDLTMAAPAVGAGGILVTQGGVPFRILCGAGAPNNNLAIQAGDLYIRSNPGGATERLYIATGAGAWTNVTCAA